MILRQFWRLLIPSRKMARGTCGHKLEKLMEFNFSKERELKMEMCYIWQSRRINIDLV